MSGRFLRILFGDKSIETKKQEEITERLKRSLEISTKSLVHKCGQLCQAARKVHKSEIECFCTPSCRFKDEAA